MKVVFLTSYFEGTEGGECAVSFEIARAFSGIYPCAIICLGDRNEIYRNGNLTFCKIESTKKAISDYAFPVFSQKNIKFMYDFLQKYSPDIVHSQNSIGIGLLGQIWALRNHIPFIFTSHSLPTKLAEFGLLDSKILAQAFKVTVTDQYLRTYFNNCACLVALNKAAQDDIRNFGYTGEIAEIPNGRNLKLYNKCRYADITKREKILFFIGWINERKNQKFLLKMLDLLPWNYKLYLAGSAQNPKFLEKLKFQAPPGALRRTTFLGPVPHEKIPGYLEKTHVFVSASTLEVQSTVILEALASGRPIVALSNETTDEFIDEAVGFRFPRNATPQDFAKKIQEICELDPDEYRRLSENARERVKDRDWSNIIPRLIPLYEKHISKAKTQPDDSAQKLGLATRLIQNTEIYKYIQEIFEPVKKRIIAKKDTIPGSTKIFAGATIAFSLAAYIGWKLFQKFTNKKLRNKR